MGTFDLASRPRATTSVVVGAESDSREREADRAAQQVTAGRSPTVSAGGACCTGCAGGGGCSAGPAPAPALGRGSPLPPATREQMGRLFGHDFSQVRVHTDEAGRREAGRLGATAFTSGWDVSVPKQALVAGAPSGLLAHELAHVVQQTRGGAPARGLVQRQAGPATAPSAPAHQVVPLAGPGVKVCARVTPIVPGAGPSHAFIDAPPFRYGLIKRCVRTGEAGPGIPLASGADLGLPLNPTAAEATEHSPDPCNATPTCVQCTPRPGVTDLDSCMADAFAAYPRVSGYVVFPGPNSNTFAGTLARSCCSNMDTPPPIGSVPGWTTGRPQAVQAQCPAGPATCQDADPGAGVRANRAIRGGVAMGLLGAAGGAGIGALLGGTIGLLSGGLVGGLAGLALGAGIGAIAGGGIGILAALYAALFR